MTSERSLVPPTRRSSALTDDPKLENSEESKKTARKGKIAPFGAVLLAFLATQHHNLHMLLFAIGIGGAGMSFMTMFPMVRRIMILMSLAMVGLMVYRALDSRRPNSMRIANVFSVVLTLGLVGWSVYQFGV